MRVFALYPVQAFQPGRCCVWHVPQVNFTQYRLVPVDRRARQVIGHFHQLLDQVQRGRGQLALQVKGHGLAEKLPWRVLAEHSAAFLVAGPMGLKTGTHDGLEITADVEPPVELFQVVDGHPVRHSPSVG